MPKRRHGSSSTDGAQHFSWQSMPTGGQAQTSTVPSPATPANEQKLLQELVELSGRQLQVMEDLKTSMDGLWRSVDGILGKLDSLLGQGGM